MAYINLLPWREEAKKVQQKIFFTLLSVIALGTLVVIFLICQFYQMRIDGQVERNEFLKNEVQTLNSKISKIKSLNEKKRELKKRKRVVEQLQHSRNVVTQVLDEMAKIIPNGIYLTRLEKHQDILNIIGKSESNNHLSNMIRAIEQSALLGNAELKSITSNEAQSKLLSDFKMRVRIKGLKITDDSIRDSTTQGTD